MDPNQKPVWYVDSEFSGHFDSSATGKPSRAARWENKAGKDLLTLSQAGTPIFFPRLEFCFAQASHIASTAEVFSKLQWRWIHFDLDDMDMSAGFLDMWMFYPGLVHLASPVDSLLWLFIPNLRLNHGGNDEFGRFCN